MRLREGKVSREELERVVGDVEGELKRILERCKGRKKWESGRKRWWDSGLEEKRREVREKEERWKRGRLEEDRREMKEWYTHVNKLTIISKRLRHQ